MIPAAFPAPSVLWEHFPAFPVLLAGEVSVS